MRGLFLTFLVVILPFVVFSHRKCKIQEFLKFKYAHNKTYANASEEYTRCEVFSENFEMIEKHNRLFKAKKVRFGKVVNKFADYTSEEFIKTFTGIPQRKVDSSPHSSEEHRRVKRSGMSTETLPNDWQMKDLDLSRREIPVKDQGACGSCWAFSATGVLEYKLYKTSGKYYDLSEQNVVDCARPNGCDGGWLSDAFNYFQQNGVDYEDIYPYRGDAKTCSRDPHDQGSGLSSAYTRRWLSIPPNEMLMAYLIAKYGWISACINATPLQFYDGKMIWANMCQGGEPNHAIILVGYGYDKKDKAWYWLGKNSWGDVWGDQGYFKLEFGKNACDITNEYEEFRAYVE